MTFPPPIAPRKSTYNWLGHNHQQYWPNDLEPFIYCDVFQNIHMFCPDMYTDRQWV